MFPTSPSAASCTLQRQPLFTIWALIFLEHSSASRTHVFLHRWILQHHRSPLSLPWIMVYSRLTEHTPADGQTCSCFLGRLCKHLCGTNAWETHGQGSGQTGGTRDRSTHRVPPRLLGPPPPRKRPLHPRRPTPQDKPGLTAPLTKHLSKHSGNPAPALSGNF